MDLTDIAIKKLQPKEKAYKVYDNSGTGLYVWVKTNGGKYFKQKYTFQKRPYDIQIGSVKKVSLKEARRQAGENLVNVEKGINPVEQKRLEKQERKQQVLNTFKAIGTQFFEEKFKLETAESTWKKIIPYFDNVVFPKIGNKPIDDLVGNDIYVVTLGIAKTGARDSAKRVARMCGRIFQYAVALGVAKMNVANGIATQLPAPIEGNFKSLTKPDEFGQLLKAIDGFDPTYQQSYVALQLLAYIFPRGGDLRFMKWTEVDTKAGTWTYKVSKLKSKTKKEIMDYVCFLPTQASALIESMRPLTGNTEYVFHSDYSRGSTPVVSDSSMRKILVSIGYKEVHDLHGFRASARTICDEELGFPSDQLEVALTHKNPTDKHGGAYARTQFLKQRRVMAQSWADYIDGLRV